MELQNLKLSESLRTTQIQSVYKERLAKEMEQSLKEPQRKAFFQQSFVGGGMHRLRKEQEEVETKPEKTAIFEPGERRGRGIATTPKKFTAQSPGERSSN